MRSVTCNLDTGTSWVTAAGAVSALLYVFRNNMEESGSQIHIGKYIPFVFTLSTRLDSEEVNKLTSFFQLLQAIASKVKCVS